MTTTSARHLSGRTGLTTSSDSVLIAAFLGCLLGVLITGSTAALQLGDPGPVVRWSAPFVRTLHDLAAAVTIGAFLFGGFLVPESARSHRRLTTSRIGAGAAATWAVAGILGVVLRYASVAGLAPTAPGFWSGLWDNLGQIDLLRSLAITAFAALAIACLALLHPGRNAQAWLFAASLLAIYPLGLVAHSGGATNHEAAVATLLLHLGGVLVWVGGLIVLAVLWSDLGRSAPAVVERYSKVATWCYVLLGLFGVVNATVHLDSFAELASGYGAVLLLKVACFGLLGVVALGQRRRVIAILRDQAQDLPARRLFVRLAAVETAGMAVAIGLGVALASSAPPSGETPIDPTDRAFALTGYPTPPRISAEHVFGMWRVEWLFSTLAVVAIGVYLAWVWRLRRRGDHWPMTRTAAWVAGWLLFLYALDGGVSVYGRVLFSAHMAQHMILAMYVPIFLVRGGVITLALRALPARRDKTLGLREAILAISHSRFTAFVGHPIVASILNFGMLVVFYYSGWFEAALRTHTGHVTMVLHFLIAGYLFAWAMVGVDPGPPRWSPPLRLVVLLVTIAFHAFFGVALMSGQELLAGGFFEQLQIPWVHDVLEDQQRAGTVTWGSGEPATLALTLLLAAEWIRRDESEARRGERQARRDDDAELRSYNDYLATLRGGPRG